MRATAPGFYKKEDVDETFEGAVRAMHRQGLTMRMRTLKGLYDQHKPRLVKMEKGDQNATNEMFKILTWQVRSMVFNGSLRIESGPY